MISCNQNPRATKGNVSFDSLDFVINCIRDGACRFDFLSESQKASVLSCVSRHKLRSYFAYIASDEAAVCYLAEANRMEGQKRAASEELCSFIHSSLYSSGIDFLIVKGLAFERLIYDFPCRDVGDIDVLVSSEDAPLLHSALIRLGYRQRMGPSSVGGPSGRALSAICTSLQDSEMAFSGGPMRRFPQKKEYAPYVKHGCLTIELHDGFYSLPDVYVKDCLGRANRGRETMMQNPVDTFFFLLTNAFENSESFYSNAYDYGIVLRDYVDLHHFVLRNGQSVDWGEIAEMASRMGLSAVFSTVIGNYKLIYGERGLPTLTEMGAAASGWGKNVIERMRDDDVARLSAYGVFRSRLRKVAAAHLIGGGLRLGVARELCVALESSLAVGFSVREISGGIAFEWDVPLALLDGDHLFQVGICPLSECTDYLLCKVDLGQSDGFVVAYSRNVNRFPNRVAIKKSSGHPLPIRIEQEDERARISVLFKWEVSNLPIAVDCEYALAVDIFARHSCDVFWSIVPDGAFLMDDVSIGRAGLLSLGSGVLSLISNGCCFTIGSDDAVFARHIAMLFGKVKQGWSIVLFEDVIVRDYQMSSVSADGISLLVDGEERFRGLRPPEALDCILQDMVDFLCQRARDSVFVAHASAIEYFGSIVLFVGTSGSGKTTFSIMASRIGAFIGDECAFVDSDTGCAWSGDFPFKINQGNESVLQHLGDTFCLPVEGGSHGDAFYFPRASVDAVPDPERPRPIRAIVFPKYNSSEKGVCFGRLPPNLLIKGILDSCMGRCAQSHVFRALVRMVSNRGIPLLSIEYSDVTEAVSVLEGFLLGGEQ